MQSIAKRRGHAAGIFGLGGIDSPGPALNPFDDSHELGDNAPGREFPGLNPANFLMRSAYVFPGKIAIVDGGLSFSYAEFADRSRRAASVVLSYGLSAGDRVAVLAANSHIMLEMHNAAPLSGTVLVALNTRLSEEELLYILRHSEARLLIASREFSAIATGLAQALGIPLIAEAPIEGRLAAEYEAELSRAQALEPREVSEQSLLAINYTSGTTGYPKGVVYQHRGAFLQALSRIYHGRIFEESVYLWTLPMFHCNGWCHTWAVSAAAARHVCVRSIDPQQIWRMLRETGVTHFSAAPTVLNMVAACEDAVRLPVTVHADTGGAPPSPVLLARLAALNIAVTHLYGLTETYGPIGINQWQAEWDELSESDRARLRARQGVGNIVSDKLRVVDDAGLDVPADGKSIGEIAARGNTVMAGYFRDPQATERSQTEGWFRTGDLAVMHPDHYVEIVDRSKDVIISGGENISSVEVERVLDGHPAVLESAVVAGPDEFWGEVPHAFVCLRVGADATAEDLTAYLRAHLAGFKVPRAYHFTELPKTSTGKIRKNVLREQLSHKD